MSPRLRLLVVPVLLAGCTRTFTAPTPLQPGTFYGTAVYQEAGTDQDLPAAGTAVSLLGSSLTATADANGNFVLGGIMQTTGSVLCTFSTTGMGPPDRQVVLSLSDYGAGPNREISAGQVVLGRNASVRGIVLRGDAPDAGTGNGGSIVFVPEGPFTATTGDDGTFVLEALPPGTVNLAAVRTGYEPYAVGEVVLQPGEEATLDPIVLIPETSTPVAGNISGTVGFDPSLPSAQDTTVGAVSAANGQQGTVAGDGTFNISALTPGLYEVDVAHVGYASAAIPNVFVASGQTTSLPLIVLQAASSGSSGSVGSASSSSSSGSTGSIGSSSSGGSSGSSGGDGGPLLTDGGPTATVLALTSNGESSPYAIVVQFSEDVSQTDLSDSTRVNLTGPEGAVGLQVSYAVATTTAVLTPNHPMTPLSTYMLTVRNVRATAFPFPGMPNPLIQTFSVREPLLSDVPEADGGPTSDGISTAPGIAWTPSGAHIMSRLASGGCGSQDFDYIAAAFDAPLDGGPLQVVATPSCSDDEPELVGATPHQVVAAGGSVFACTGENDSASNVQDGNYWIAQYSPGGWIGVAAVNDCRLGTDGTNLYNVSEYDGLVASIYDAETGNLDSIPLNVSGLTDAGADPSSGGVGGDDTTTFFAGGFDSVDSSAASTVLFCPAAGQLAAQPCAQTELAIAVTAPNVYVLNGLPVVVVGEQQSSGWRVHTYVGASADGGISLTQHGSPIGTQPFSTALRGHTLFLATAEGGIMLRHLDLDDPDADWIVDPGNQTGTLALSSTACPLTDSAGVASSLDGLWVVWSESCVSDGSGNPIYDTHAAHVY